MSTRSLESRAAQVGAVISTVDDRSRVELDDFVRACPRLFATAHRIVGTVPEAEDILQEVWLRWHRVDRTTVVDVEAFLVTVTVRLAINVVQSARRRHETCVGPWLGAQAADPDADPVTAAERGEAIEMAVHLLLERRPPSERAAFVLREGFDYPYQQIARTLQIGTANARQLVKRARTRIAAGRRHSYSSTARSRLLGAFAPASLVGELTGLEAVLVADLKRAG